MSLLMLIFQYGRALDSRSYKGEAISSSMEEDICSIMCVCSPTGSFVLYIPIVKEDMKCLSLDNKTLKKAAIFLRSITDILYILNIVIQFYIEPKAKAFRVMWKAYWRSHVPIDILAILPIPQVLEASFSYSVYL